MSIGIQQANNLKDRWINLVKENPKMRIRDAAAELGVSEGEILATDVGNSVVKLNKEFKPLLHELNKLGKVMALTRKRRNCSRTQRCL